MVCILTRSLTYMLYAGAFCFTNESLIPYLLGPGAQFLKKNVFTFPIEYSGDLEPLYIGLLRNWYAIGPGLLLFSANPINKYTRI